MPPKKKGGRYTPKGGPAPKTPAPRANRSTPDDTAQVGRRPSPTWFLAVIAVLWLGAAAVVALKVDAAWKIVPAVVFAGVGLFYLRAAMQTVVRREALDDRRD